MHGHNHIHALAARAGRSLTSHLDSQADSKRDEEVRGVDMHLPVLDKRALSNDKPITVSSTTIPIVLGIVIPVVAAAIAFLYLHRRNVRRQRAEDAKDASTDLDFGLGDASKKGKRKSIFGMEKQAHRPGQLSMDMNLSSPYLLHPGATGSHDSVHSLTRLPEDHDPYRIVAQYTNSETASIASFNPTAKTPSLHSRMNSVHASTGKSTPLQKSPPPRINSLPRAPIAISEKTNPFSTPTLPQPVHHSPLAGEIRDSALPVKPIIPEIATVGHENDRSSDKGLDTSGFQLPPRSNARSPANPNELPQTAAAKNVGMARSGSGNHDGNSQSTQGPAGLGLNLDLPRAMSPTLELPSDKPVRRGTPPKAADNMYAAPQPQPQIHTSEYQDYDDYDRGRSTQRQTSVDYKGEQVGGGLGVPAQEGKRLSVGFRPLPPDEVTESEDPEYRANRIRSFYKEYFEEKEPAPPMPGQPQSQGHGNDYYEDYDQSYLGDAAYYDADTNAFVMPYSQPVTRRAMTPPPSGRFRGEPQRPGPRGPPRGGPVHPHGPRGSLGGSSMPGGPRRPRAGSAFSPRAPSSIGPRPDSSASGAWGRQMPKKKAGPPPSALTTLPTPSKLKDDSFALVNSIDFAPPETFRDHAAGRSQSPLGERRPYSPAVAVASPLVTAFDELAVLPSPHLLRKSSTFTGLDFAPPKKFQDSDNKSDAGSIRSNRSGISTAQLSAIRGGAGRVSRLPGDTVFTAASQFDQLKPSWNMRP